MRNTVSDAYAAECRRHANVEGAGQAKVTMNGLSCPFLINGFVDSLETRAFEKTC